MKKLLNKGHRFWMEWAARLFFGIYFIVAAYPKMMHPGAFAEIIRRYGMIPDGLSPFVAVVLPWLEYFTGLFLIVGIFHDGARWWGGVLLVLFTLLLAVASVRGLSMDCGCGVALFAEKKVGWSKVLENTLLLIVYYYLLLHKSIKTKGL